MLFAPLQNLYPLGILKEHSMDMVVNASALRLHKNRMDFYLYLAAPIKHTLTTMEVEKMRSFEVKKIISVNKTIRLPSDLCDTAEKLAERKGISFNQFILQAVKYAMENLKDDDETTNA
jgi:septin family protein